MTSLYIIGGMFAVAIFLLVVVAPVFLTRVPYVPTPVKRYDIIFDYLARHRELAQTSFVDFGCGYGNMLFAAEARGCRTVIGIERSPVHAWIARVRARLLRSHVKIIRRDAFRFDFHDADVVYLFLSKAVVDKVFAHVAAYGRPGTLVMVLADAITGRTPVDILTPDGPHGTKIYCYCLEKRA